MAWSVKTPYAMFEYWRGTRQMAAHHDSVLDKRQMEDLWETGTPVTVRGIECEKFDRRDLDLEFHFNSHEGSYDFLWFEDIPTGVLYPMFISDAGRLLENDQLRKKISGTFKVVRHGACFGIAMV